MAGSCHLSPCISCRRGAVELRLCYVIRARGGPTVLAKLHYGRSSHQSMLLSTIMRSSCRARESDPGFWKHSTGLAV